MGLHLNLRAAVSAALNQFPLKILVSWTKIISSLAKGRTCISADAREFGLVDSTVNKPASFHRASLRDESAGMTTGASFIDSGQLVHALCFFA